MCRTIESAFDNCLKMIADENASIEDCLTAYPQHKNELAALLTLTQGLKQLNQCQPSEKFLENAENRLIAKLPEQTVTFWGFIRRKLQERDKKPVRRLAMAQFLLTIMMLVSLATGGVYASSTAEPGDFLYDVNRNIQEIRLVFTTKPEAIVAARLAYAEQRLQDAANKIEENDFENAIIAIEAYQSEIAALAQVIAGTEGLQYDTLTTMQEEALAIHQGVLGNLLTTVPDEARVALEKASGLSFPAIDLPDDGPPADLPPVDPPAGPPADLPPVTPPVDPPAGPPADLPPVTPPVDPPAGPPADLPPVTPPVDPPAGPPADLPPGNPPVDPPAGPPADLPPVTPPVDPPAGPPADLPPVNSAR